MWQKGKLPTYVCSTSKVAHMKVDSDDKDMHLELESDLFIGTLTVHSFGATIDIGNPWIVTLCLNGKPVLFKFDTGADVIVILEKVFKQLEGALLIVISYIHKSWAKPIS